jgi:Flp pilus assembly pilin Flp
VRKMLTDPRGSTSFEYARVAAAVALVLFEVMQAPTLFIVMHMPAKVLGTLIMEVFAGLGSHVLAS